MFPWKHVRILPDHRLSTICLSHTLPTLRHSTSEVISEDTTNKYVSKKLIIFSLLEFTDVFDTVYCLWLYTHHFISKQNKTPQFHDHGTTLSPDFLLCLRQLFWMLLSQHCLLNLTIDSWFEQSSKLNLTFCLLSFFLFRWSHSSLLALIFIYALITTKCFTYDPNNISEFRSTGKQLNFMTSNIKHIIPLISPRKKIFSTILYFSS